MAQTDWLVFGATGAVGHFLMARLQGRGDSVLAVSRRPPSAGAARRPGIVWLRADLADAPVEPLADVARVLSAGPLDAFSHFCLRASWPPGTRIVALSSMSALSKQASGDAEERALSARLLASERRLVDIAAARGWRVTVLRPTLIWGAGLDHSLSALVALARRWHWLLLPQSAIGLRQPVHADDLAQAMLVAADHHELDRAILPLPGGETLAFDAMVARCLAAAAPQARLVRVPAGLARFAVAVLEQLPGRAATLAAQLRRSAANLVVEEPSGWRRLGLEPRAFQPTRDAFRVPR